jgi:RNA polymerase sigma-70 factor (ECF subfamily)
MNPIEIVLWENIKEGDLKSFELLFHSYYRSLHTYATDLLSNTQDGEEIVLDFFYNLWDKRESIHILTSLKYYLYRSVHNSCINFIKHRQAEYRKRTDFKNEVMNDAQLNLLISEDFLLEKLTAHELEQEVMEVINQLPHQCREIFYLSRFENKKIREVAEMLNISESTVKTQIFRALEKIKDQLNRHLQ